MKNNIKNNPKNNITNSGSNNGKELFELLGDLDENMVEDAWAEHGEEVIIMEEKSPLRFVKLAAAAVAAIAIVGGGIYGFTKFKNSVGFSPAATTISEDESSAAEEFSEPEFSEPEISEPDITEPIDKPTIFVGLDGKPIMSSEVFECSKAPADITLEDLGAYVICEGFHYFREPAGIAYNSFLNPEKFDDDGYVGELPVNTNEWKRVCVGEEICGLKLVTAATVFHISDPEVDEAPTIDGVEIDMDFVDILEFEGTIQVEGFLSVVPDEIAPAGSVFFFTPTEDVLPIVGGSEKSEKGSCRNYFVSTIQDMEMLKVANELPSVTIASSKVSYEDIDNLELGYTVLARVTLSNIRYAQAAFVIADIDDVMVLTEPFEQIDSSAPKFSETGARIPIGKFLK